MWLIKVRAGTVRVSRSATGPPIPSTARPTVSASEVGLDQYQVRGYRAWYAHITLAMLAATYLATYLAATRAQEAEKGGSGPGGHAGGSGLIPVSSNEIRRPRPRACRLRERPDHLVELAQEPATLSSRLPLPPPRSPTT
jgi:hypothetical protein